MRKVMIWMMAAVCFAAIAKQRTTRTKLHADSGVEVSAVTASSHTVCGDSAVALVRVSGYEKPLRSRHETMLLTNNDSIRTVTEVSLNITYLDMQGRTLHNRTAKSTITLPPGATRLLDLKSWDVNMLFYYHLNAPTRTAAQGTAYRVTVTPEQVVVAK